MKIVSKFQDYYDIGVSMGVDESLVYVRNLEATLYPNDDIPFDRRSYVAHRKQSRIEHIFKDVVGKRPVFSTSPVDSLHFVGFCGKLYPFIFVDYLDKHHNRIVGARYYMTKEVIREMQETYSISKRYRLFREDEEEANIKKFNRLLGMSFDAPEMFHVLKTPVFIMAHEGSRVEKFLNGGVSLDMNTEQGDIVWLNPCLKDFDFYKVFDSFTAFQEISMFITGVLGENKIPPVQISDTDMRDAKGFDERSFKKDPTKKHKRRKNG